MTDRVKISVMGITHSQIQKGAYAVLLTEDEAAQLLKIQPATLATWRVKGRPNLPFVRVGRCVRYRRQDILAFIEGHLASHTGQGRA